MLLEFDYDRTGHWGDVRILVRRLSERVAGNLGGKVLRRTERYTQRRVEVVFGDVPWVGRSLLELDRDAFRWAALNGCADLEVALGVSGVAFRASSASG